MRIVSAPDEMVRLLKKSRDEDKTVGLVPTMGALHDGHFKLIDSSKSVNQITVVSIFINPLQFNNKEDLKNYPRDLDEDLKQLEDRNVDFAFVPDKRHMYPSEPRVSLKFGEMSSAMEGKFREGHFEGVGVVVSKLLNIIRPTNTYFGLKDLQQYLLIKRMCYDLNFQSNIIGIKTEREANGLAMSSRNRRLSETGLEVASNLYKGLKQIDDGLIRGESLRSLLSRTAKYYESIDGLEIEYLESVNGANLEPVSSLDEISELAICVAGYVEGIRLIDNLYLRLK